MVFWGLFVVGENQPQPPVCERSGQNSQLSCKLASLWHAVCLSIAGLQYVLSTWPPVHLWRPVKPQTCVACRSQLRVRARQDPWALLHVLCRCVHMHVHSCLRVCVFFHQPPITQLQSCSIAWIGCLLLHATEDSCLHRLHEAFEMHVALKGWVRSCMVREALLQHFHWLCLHIAGMLGVLWASYPIIWGLAEGSNTISVTAEVSTCSTPLGDAL